MTRRACFTRSLFRNLIALHGCAVVFAAPALAAESGGDAASDGPAQTVFAPPAGKPGPIVVALSGQSGRGPYEEYAADLSRLGYYVVLLDGKDVLNPERTGPANLGKGIARAQKAPGAIPGKVAIVGFSLGGGGALYSAANQPDAVSVVVAYYPFTRTWADHVDVLVGRFKVPILVLAGEADRYKDCCVIETVRALGAAAKARGLPFDLVEYPGADHGFNHRVDSRGRMAQAYRADYAQDAWRRTVEMLKRYQPLP